MYQTQDKAQQLYQLRFVVEALCVVGLILVVALPLANWGSLPEMIPSHFSVDGTVTEWSGRGMLLILPGAAVGLYALLTVTVRFPNGFNYPVKVHEGNRERQRMLAHMLIVFVKTELVWLLAALTWTTIEVAAGTLQSMPSYVLIGFLGVMFGTIIVYFALALKDR